MVVTGASGFIGSQICRRLEAAGHEAVAFVRKSSNRQRLQGSDLEVMTGDIRNQDSLRTAFHHAEAVVHCAALADPYANPWESRAVNFIAAFNVCRAATDSGVSQLVQMSTAAVYARDHPRGVPLREEARLVKEPPVYDTYSINKAAAEGYVQDFGRAGRLATTILRPGVVYGPGDRVSAALVSLMHRGKLIIPAGRDRRLPLIHVDDLGSAVLAALSNSPAGARRYNLDGPRPVTFAAFADALARNTTRSSGRVLTERVAHRLAWGFEKWWHIQKLEGRPPLNRYAVDLITADMILDTIRGIEELKWEPAVSLDEGAQLTSEWLGSEPADPAAGFPPLA
ncbi:MAG: NAD(P)-dependent oxidoreductase [Dehalococcoidia bacterium]